MRSVWIILRPPKADSALLYDLKTLWLDPSWNSWQNNIAGGMLEALFSETEKASIVLTLTEFNGGLAQKIEEYCACHVRKCLGATVSLTKDCIAYF